MAALGVLGCAACAASTPAPQGAVAERVRDPLATLPSADRYIEAVAPYRFASEHVRRLDVAVVRLGQSTNPTARLVLARAWLDAALYAEVAADAAFDEELSASLRALPGSPGSAWLAADGLFAEIEADMTASDEVRRMATSGRALVALLLERGMDAAYHRQLGAFAEEGGVFVAEARVAALLDSVQALLAASDVPWLERSEALRQALEPGLCPAEASVGVCERACVEANPHLRELPPERFELVMLATCGFEAVGFHHAATADLYGPELRVAVAAYRRVATLVQELHRAQGHPLIDAMLPQVERLHAELARHALPLPVVADDPRDFADRPLPVSEVPRTVAQPTDPVLVMIDHDGVRVALTPHLVADEHGATFAELESGFAFPGRLVASWADIEAPGDVRGAVIVEHLIGVFAEADAVARPPAEPSSATAVFVAADLPQSRLARALGLLRGAMLEGRRLDLALAFWSSVDDQQRFVPVAMLPGGTWGGHAFESLPDEARPLDLRIALEADRVDLVGRGRVLATIPDRGGELDRVALGDALARLAASSPGEVAVVLEFAQSSRDTTSLLVVIAALQVANPALERIYLSSAGR